MAKSRAPLQPPVTLLLLKLIKSMTDALAMVLPDASTTRFPVTVTQPSTVKTEPTRTVIVDPVGIVKLPWIVVFPVMTTGVVGETVTEPMMSQRPGAMHGAFGAGWDP